LDVLGDQFRAAEDGQLINALWRDNLAFWRYNLDGNCGVDEDAGCLGWYCPKGIYQLIVS
jgi:hypothetical protein